MQKQTLRRMLSALLALCLFVGLMPQIAPEQEIVAQAAAATMYYDFTKANTGSYGADAAAKRAAFAALTYDAVAALNTSIASDPWAYHSYSYVSEDSTDASAFAGYGYNADNDGKKIGLVVVPGSRKSVMNAAVKVKVASAGSYMPLVNIHGGFFKGYAGTATIKFRALNSDGSLGTTLASKELFLSDYPEADTYVPLATKAVSLSATEYALEFVINNERTIIAVDGLKLLAADSATLYSIDPTNSDGVIEVKVGQSVTIPFTQKMTDGTTSTTRFTGWNWTTNNSYVTVEVNSRSQYYTITGTAVTSKAQTVEFWNGAVKTRLNVIVRAANYTPTATDLYYDFTKVLPESLTVNHVHNIAKFIKYNHTTVGGYGEINAWTGTASAISVFSQPWKVSNIASTVTFSPLFHNYGIQSKKQGVADIKIKVPVDGVYLPQLNLYQALATPVTMSVINSSGSTLCTKTLAAGTSGTRVNFANSVISLKAGEYTVRFNKLETGSSADAGANYYDGLFFAYKGPIGTKLNMNANRNVAMAVGGSSTVKLNLSMSNGSAVDYTNGKVTVTMDNSAIATATTTGSGSSLAVKFTSKAAGTTSATITFTNGVFTASQTVIISSSASTKLYMSATKTALKPTDTAGSQITVKTADGAVINSSSITYSSANTKVATVSSTGLIKPVAVGTTNINAVTTYGGTTYNLYIAVKVTEGKTSSSWYTTADRRTGSKTNVTKADTYLNGITDLWSIITTQELPRGAAVGHRYDPEMFKCRYCGLDFATSQWGSYAYRLDPVNDPWKLQCPSCTRVFPSNDFENFYKLGIGSDGMWSYELAKSENAKLVAQGKTGYLTNTRNPEKGAGWGVDDGYGYHSGKMIVNGKGETAEQVYTYIAYYNHWGIWYKMDSNPNDGIVQRLLEALPSAYFYTGDIKYGKAAAILVDRIADVYPTLYMEPYFPLFFNSDSTQPKGKMVGSIWQHTLSRVCMKAYDAVYDAYEDPTVVEAIAEKAAQYDLGSAKLTTVAIRDRIEERLILQTYKDIRNGNIHGNFGMHQSCAAYAGVIYDTLPKTKEILDWVYASSSDTYGSPDISGGNVTAQLINLVDRDGHGAESAPNYNELWGRNLSLLAEAVAGYKTYEAGDLYQNPRFVLMLKSLLPLVLVRNQVAQIGDSSAVGLKNYIIQDQFLRDGFIHTGDIEYAQFLYHKNKANPNKIAASVRQQVLDIIEEHGEYDFDKSRQLTGYGFSIIRDGTYKENADGTITDTQRDFWLYYGAANSHKHADVLNLGIEAYGVNVAPDIGYPTAADGSDKSTCWEQSTVMHNTVMTNNQSHNRIRSYTNGTPRNNGRPLHFDDSGRVKVMDVNAPPGSTNGTANGIFRRSIVMVRVNDEVSYGVDFFRVKGGNEHLYNFHAMSDEIYATEGLTLVAQSGGSYAGANIAYETKGYANGFTYLKNVRRATNCTSGNFAVDFKIKDFRSDWAQDMNLHLRINMVNGFALSEVALATGVPPQRDGNPATLEFMMARRSGTNLDSLFTAVYEPYKDSRYIKSISNVTVTRTGGATEGTNDVAKAIQVVRTDGITDYIVYATNNQVTYKVAGLYDFQGFVGVFSVKNGSLIYAYGNDATKVNTTTSTAAYTGTITDFTKTLEFDNYIDVQFSSAIDANKIIGKYIDIENGRTENAVFEILDATSLGSNKYRLDVGEKSLITATADASDLSKGYIYNAAAGNTFRIPLPTVVSSTTVTLNTNGGTATGNKPTVTATYGANMPPVDDAIPTKTGYTFNGYYDTTNTSGTRYYNQNGKSVHAWDKDEATATLYAAWKANTYTVSYNANGGSGTMANSSHTYNTTKALNANAFTREGYIFQGWATSSSATTAKYTDKQSVKNLTTTNGATVTLYAVWTPNTYSVKYNANGGSGTMSNSSHTYGTAKALTANAFTKTGYTFQGWDTNSAGTAVVHTDKKSVSNLTATNGATVNLYAVWTANTYTVTLSAADATTAGTASVTATYGSAMPSATMPTRTGYTFAGYYDAASGGTQYYKADGTSARSWNKAAATTLYARWTGSTYTVTLDPTNGTGGTASVSATYGSAMPSVTPPTKTGFTFKGYYDAASGGTQYYKADGTSAKAWDKEEAATLYARWTRNTYTVTLNANGGTAGTASVTASYNLAMPEIATLPTRDGYTFEGYYDAASGGTQYYKADGTSARTWNKAAATTLYAVWTPNTYSVKYNANGGSGTMSNSSHTYGTAKALTANAFTKTGYTFQGWDTNSAGTTVVHTDKKSVSNLTATNGATVNLYAVWKAATSTVTLNDGTNTSTVTATYGSAMPNITPPEKAGAIFNGYFDAASGGTKYYNADGTSAKNWDKTGAQTLYAQWTQSEVTLSAIGNKTVIAGDTVSFTASATSSIGGTITYSGTSLPSGASINASTGAFSWNTTLSQIGSYTFTIKATDGFATASRSVTVTVNAPTSAVTLNNRNATEAGTASVTATYGSAMPAITAPTRTGYTFAGYYDATSGGTQYYKEDGTSARIWNKTGATTLYARWTANTYTITLNEGGAVTATYGSAMPEIETPTKTGYIFAGYYEAENGEGTQYYKADGSSAKNWDKAGNVTLYAKWIEGEVTITQIEDKTVEVNEELSFTVEATSTAPGDITYTAENLPDGATFNENTGEFTWTPTIGQVGEYTIIFRGSDGVSYAEVTVKVEVVVLASTVTLDNGDSTTTVSATYGFAMPKIEVPTKTGYIFAGYFDGENGTGTKYYNADGSSAKNWDKAGNVTLYAKWIEGEVIITQIEDKTVGVNKELSFTVEATSTAPGDITYTAENLPDGATFNENTGEFTWTPTIGQVGEHTIIFKGSDGVSYAEVTVKVEVITIESTVTLNDGSKTSTITAIYGEALPAITIPTKTGYVFGGYFTEKNGGGTQYYKANGTSAKNWDKTDNVTLYAKWEQGADIFGTTSAYIRNISFVDEDGTTKYRIYLFAGIDTLKYKEVGFEISSGDKVVNMRTNTAFNSFMATNATVTPATLGAKCTKIFAQSATFSEDYKTADITYRPYAIDLNGNYIYGKYVTINGAYIK